MKLKRLFARLIAAWRSTSWESRVEFTPLTVQLPFHLSLMYTKAENRDTVNYSFKGASSFLYTKYNSKHSFENSWADNPTTSNPELQIYGRACDSSILNICVHEDSFNTVSQTYLRYSLKTKFWPVQGRYLFHWLYRVTVLCRCVFHLSVLFICEVSPTYS